MKTIPILSILCLLAFFLGVIVGCAGRPSLRSTSKVPEAARALLDVLARRDTQTLDLVTVGQNLIKIYGPVTADLAVRRAWFDLTRGAGPEKAGDVVWLQDQAPRVRDVAWLLRYRNEWQRNAK